jgi:hypothetical protein
MGSDDGYHKHGHDGPGERMGQGVYPFESFPQAPDDKFRYDEVSAAGLIGFFFPFSGFSVRPLLHDERVDVLQPHKKFIGVLRRAVPPGGGRRCLERAQDVMRVFITVLDDLSLEDDGFCLLDLERRSLNVVGEVRLKEREILACDAGGRGISGEFLRPQSSSSCGLGAAGFVGTCHAANDEILRKRGRERLTWTSRSCCGSTASVTHSLQSPERLRSCLVCRTLTMDTLPSTCNRKCRV